MITVILPVRALEGAKARLSGVLNPAERRRLFTAMLQDVLRQVLRHPQLKPALVVTSDAETRCFAKRMGADVLAEPDEKGLSASVAHAQRISCLADGSDCLFIPGDVPLVTARDLDGLLAGRERLDLVIAPARDLGGTNGLLVRAGRPFPFAFGADSFRRHLQLARAAGLNTGVRSSSTLGLDIDEPADLAAAWRQMEVEGTLIDTRQVMVDCGIPGRLQKEMLFS